jgi:hypothetical protein
VSENLLQDIAVELSADIRDHNALGCAPKLAAFGELVAEGSTPLPDSLSAPFDEKIRRGSFERCEVLRRGVPHVVARQFNDAASTYGLLLSARQPLLELRAREARRGGPNPFAPDGRARVAKKSRELRVTMQSAFELLDLALNPSVLDAGIDDLAIWQGPAHRGEPVMCRRLLPNFRIILVVAPHVLPLFGPFKPQVLRPSGAA